MDKRSSPRDNIDAIVRLRIFDEDSGTAESGFQLARLSNISTTGVGIITKQIIRPGSVVEIDMDLKGKNMKRPMPVHTFCKVQWSGIAGYGIYEAGLDFIVIKQRDIRKLNACIKRNTHNAPRHDAAV